MQNVVSDPVITRPLRPDAPSGRAASTVREPAGAFDAMLDSPPADTPPPRNDRPLRTETRDRASDTRDDTRTEPPRARDTDRPAPSAEQNQSKSAGPPPTRQAKNGQSSNRSNNAAKGSDKAPAENTAAPNAPDPTAAAVPAQGAVAPVKAAEAALVEAEGAATQPTADTGKDKTSANADADTGADAGVQPTADAKPAGDAVAVVVAVAVQAPVTPVAVTDPTIDVAAIAAVATAPAAEAAAAAASAAPTPAPIRATTGAAPTPGAADAADAKTPAKDAAPKLAAEAIAQAGAQVAAETPQIPGLKAQADKTATKSPGEPKIDSKGKSETPEHLNRAATDARAAEAPDAVPAESTNPQTKAVASREEQHHATELAIATRAAAAEARGDSATAAATAAANTAPATTAAPPGAPILPFNLQLSSALTAPTQPTALRVDAADAAVPIAGLAVEIVSRAQDGNKRFDIRLDPPELGRIDVRLDVDQGGKVTSRLIVERSDTLDLLRRDAPQLERALQHAGLNTDGGLQFSLRDQNFTGRDQSQGNGANVSQLIIPEDEQAASEAARRGYGRLIGLGGGVDIRV